jgi:hypothetical protein
MNESERSFGYHPDWFYLTGFTSTYRWCWAIQIIQWNIAKRESIKYLKKKNDSKNKKKQRKYHCLTAEEKLGIVPLISLFEAKLFRKTIRLLFNWFLFSFLIWFTIISWLFHLQPFQLCQHSNLGRNCTTDFVVWSETFFFERQFDYYLIGFFFLPTIYNNFLLISLTILSIDSSFQFE